MTFPELLAFALLVAVAVRFTVATTWDKTIRPPERPVTPLDWRK